MPDGAAVGSSVAAIHQNDGVGVGYSVGHCVGDAVTSRSKTTERRLDRSVAVSGVVRPIRASRKGESAGSGTQRPRLAAHAHRCVHLCLWAWGTTTTTGTTSPTGAHRPAGARPGRRELKDEAALSTFGSAGKILQT
jgi:hypothetical protein